jgi:hypothetical protein
MRPPALGGHVGKHNRPEKGDKKILQRDEQRARAYELRASTKPAFLR